VLRDAVVDEEIHTTILPDDVTQRVADLVTERGNPPSSIDNTLQITKLSKAFASYVVASG